MEAINKKENLAINILQEKCPHCGQGHVFQRQKSVFKMPVMNEKCSECDYKFDREPGYFLGAMYISYGIAVFLGILTYLFLHFAFPAMPLICTPISIVLVILFAARKNYKLSRVIYIHMFPW
jgi:uncharacterized protein (DUF983 family)